MYHFIDQVFNIIGFYYIFNLVQILFNFQEKNNIVGLQPQMPAHLAALIAEK